MPCKSRKSWQKTIYRALSLVLFSFFAMSSARAFPDVERLPSSGDAPLSYSTLSSDPTLLLMPPSGTDFEDRFLIAAGGDQLFVIDTETWELFADQPEVFEASVKGLGFLPNSNSLFASLSNGTVVRVEIDDLTADPSTIDISDEVDDASLGPMVIDADSGDDQAYILDINNKEMHILDIGDHTVTSVSLKDTSNVTYTPTGIAFANLSSTDKVFVSTSDSAVLVFNEGATAFSVLAPDSDTHNFVAIAATPSSSGILVVDATDNAVWVIDPTTNTFSDQVTGGNAVDPIAMDSDGDDIENSSLTHILATDVLSPDDVYAYVGGEQGLSVIDVSAPTTALSTSKLIDLDENSTEDANDPIALSEDVVALAASSDEDGYLYVGNSGDEISVITDNPFVTISASSASGSLTTSSPTFTLTFQSDETGTYRVVLDSDVHGDSGTELIASTTLDTANTDTTTASIDVTTVSAFEEGTNRIFIFVTDADGNVGRDAFDVTVDLPPDEVTLTDLSFGNQKIFATFTPLDASDISQYLILVEAATGSSCPGTLDFSALDASTADASTTVSGSDCTSADDACTGTITGLSNGIAYCVGIRATDTSSQTSATTNVFAEIETPELTSSLSDIAGEGGWCSLAVDAARPSSRSHNPFLLVFILGAGLGFLNLWRRS